MKVILNDKEVPELVTESLPMLIHGQEGSGASMYTIALAAKWYEQGYNVLFLCGYEMAEEEFIKLVGQSNGQFFTKERQDDFKKLLNEPVDKRVVVVKNIELFGEDIIDLVSILDKVIISGDLNQSAFKDKILAVEYVTKFYFSEIEGISLPDLKKYEGFVIANNFEGVTKLQP